MFVVIWLVPFGLCLLACVFWPVSFGLCLNEIKYEISQTT